MLYYSEYDLNNIHNMRNNGYIYIYLYTYTLNGRIGKVVASHAEVCKVARSNPG